MKHQGVHIATRMLYGHMDFLVNNKGDTVGGHANNHNRYVDKYVLNNQWVLANNRHYLSDTRQEYQPNGDATTEGQSLLITAFVYAYLATDDVVFKEAAKESFEAYTKYFYADDPIPATPSRWIANWILNGKEPCLANYPRNPTEPTEGGFKCVPLNFINGVAEIPWGAPFWGEYLDVVQFAHRGMLAWNAINATPKTTIPPITQYTNLIQCRIQTNPTDLDTLQDQFNMVNWAQTNLGIPPSISYQSGSDLPEYEIDWIDAWTGNRITGGGDIIDGSALATSLNTTPFKKGQVKLKDQNLPSGVYLLNFATRQPEHLGGYLFARNEVWHNRPIHAPLKAKNATSGRPELRGNAADGEVWFADACYTAWKHLENQSNTYQGDRYYRAWKSCEYTSMEYMQIDREDRFFRRTRKGDTPFTDGISYDFQYPSNAVVTYTRDRATGGQGILSIHVDREAKHQLEQQAVVFSANPSVYIHTEWGGIDSIGSPLGAEVLIGVSTQKTGENETIYAATLAASTDSSLKIVNTKITDFVKELDENGDEYLIAKLGTVAGPAYLEYIESADFLGNGLSSNVVQIDLAVDSLTIGTWLYASRNYRIKPETLTYSASAPTIITFIDADGWRFEKTLPATVGWVSNYNLDLANTAVLTEWYQPIKWPTPQTVEFWPTRNSQGLVTLSDTYDPTYKPNMQIGLDGMGVKLNTDLASTGKFQYYCINTQPARFNQSEVFVTKYRITIIGDNSYTAKLGDCKVVGAPSSLYGVPGVVPFSNIYVVGSEAFGAWHGLPYPGYQYPWLFIHNNRADYPESITMLKNATKFLHGSQRWYKENIGVLGPGASAFVWDRWDNVSFGEANTWTMYHWGNGHAWDGYQPRAFYAAARAWQDLKLVYHQYSAQEKIEIDKIIIQLKDYTENWIKWLVEFCRDLSVPTYTQDMVDEWIADYTDESDWRLDNPTQVEKQLWINYMVEKAKYDYTNYRCTPTTFPQTQRPVPIYDDFTGHMTGLWLAGASLAKMAGSTVPHLDWLMDFCLGELSKNYVITQSQTDSIMNGSWQSWPGGGYWYGFWTPEIMRGLSLYILAHNGKQV